MKRVLVTGADGFVGRWVLRALLADEWDVCGAVQPGSPHEDGLTAAERDSVRWTPLELGDPHSVRHVTSLPFDAVIHLAAVASGGDALRDPGHSWAVNAGGTARLLGEFGRVRVAGGGDPLVVVVSTAEVYGRGARGPIRETAEPAPCSPYAASKLGAEIAARETSVRTGLRTIVARPFPHTGPGQDERFVLPALARRLRGARFATAKVVKVGNLEAVRDFSDVRDVAAAYVALLRSGVPGGTYNVASGQGRLLAEVFEELAAIIGVRAIAEPDAELMRPADIPELVGDSSKLREATGWAPVVPFERTLRDLVDAQAD